MFIVNFVYFDKESVAVRVNPSQFDIFQKSLAKNTLFFNTAEGKAFWTNVNKIRYLTIENEMDSQECSPGDDQAPDEQSPENEQEASAGAAEIDN